MEVYLPPTKFQTLVKLFSSFPPKRESSLTGDWIPAFAGMTYHYNFRYNGELLAE